jgi:Spy/CpxP family protein refolding chaperone
MTHSKMVVVGVGVLVAGVLGTAFAGSAGLCNRGGALGFGHWGRHCDVEDQAEALEHAQSATRRTLTELDVTEEQQERVVTIVDAAVGDLYDLADRHRANRDAFVTAMSRADVDRTELEQIRTAEMQLADSGSSRMLAAMAEIAEILTREQRSQLIDQIGRHR